MELDVYKAFTSVGVAHELAAKAAVALYDARQTDDLFRPENKTYDIKEDFGKIKKSMLLNTWLLGVTTGLLIVILMDLFLRH
jgi:hypothetical protein